MSQAGAPLNDPRLEQCHHCGETVPVGAFCGNCGAQLADEVARGRARRFAYAAGPHEPVVRPSVISTLFPHLPHRHAHLFRDLLAAGVVIIGILCAFRLFSSATIAAAVILPILYVLYLYEVEVYEHEPLLVIAATFVAGAALGIAFALVGARFVVYSFGPTPASILTYGVAYPLIAQLLMIAGPLLLLGRKHFNETLDGLSFGAASALGFTMTAIVAGYWHTLTGPLLGSTGAALPDILRLVRLGIFGAIVNASTTALIACALWVRRHRRSRGRHSVAWRGLPAVVGMAFALQIVLGILTTVSNDLLAVVIIWGVAAGVALVALRVVVHHALLDEGGEHVVGPAAACAECHRLVPTMLFCPACGVARSAAPKRAPAPDRPISQAASAGTAT